MEIVELQPSQAGELSQFIRQIFDKHVAGGFVQEGREEFYTYIDPVAIAQRLGVDHWVLAALEEGRLLGVIEVRNSDHVAMLFVRSDLQRQGIGRRIFTAALEKCKQLKPDLTKLTVNASPNAVEAYKRLGFVVVAAEQVKNGIRFTAMERAVV